MGMHISIKKEKIKVKKMTFEGRLTLFGILLIAISMIAYSGHVWSQEAEDHGHAAPHGGEVRTTEKFHVELVVKDHGIEVYLLDINQKPLPVKEDMSGVAYLTFEDRTPKKLSLIKALHGGQIRRADDIFVELVIEHEGIDIYLLDETQKPISISADFSGSISVKFPDKNVKKASLKPVLEVKEDDDPHIEAPIDLSDAETFDAEVNLDLGKLGKKAFKFQYKSEEHEAEEHESEQELLPHFEAPINLSKVDKLTILVRANLGEFGEKAGEKQFKVKFSYTRHKEEEHKEESSEHHD